MKLGLYKNIIIIRNIENNSLCVKNGNKDFQKKKIYIIQEI